MRRNPRAQWNRVARSHSPLSAPQLRRNAARPPIGPSTTIGSTNRESPRKTRPGKIIAMRPTYAPSARSAVAVAMPAADLPTENTSETRIAWPSSCRRAMRYRPPSKIPWIAAPAIIGSSDAR